MSRPVFGFVPAAPFIAPALPVAVPAVAGAAVAGVGLAASLPVLVAVGAGLAGGFLLGAGLAQLWGRVAGPPRSKQITLADRTTTQVVYNSQKTITFTIYNYISETRVNCSTGQVTDYSTGPNLSTTRTRTAFGIRISAGNGSYTGGCGVDASVVISRFGQYQLFDGVNWLAPVDLWGGSFQKPGDRAVTTSWQTWFSALTVDGVAYVPPGIPTDWLGVDSASDFTQLSEAFSSSTTVPPSTPVLPGDEFANLVGDPLTEQETGNAAAPALPPLIAPTFWPALAPAGRPIAADGNLVPLPPALPATTPADVHFPVPGGSPVGGLAQSPPATLAGIAAEVGRIEAKLNRLLNPLAPGDSTDLLQLLWQAIQALYNSMADNRPAGEYLLSTPCELDEDGDRIVSSVGYPETSDNTAAVLARIDALAALLQTHKDLKQPICRQTPAVGQPVQVQFVQIG